MHSVRRSPEPDYLAEIRAAHGQYADLRDPDRIRIREALKQDFGRICAYCERTCQPSDYGRPGDRETSDHFRPQSLFPEITLDWLNLVYACHRCNRIKDNRWPRNNYDNTVLPVSMYVNPNATKGQRPAEEFFRFNIETGEIAAASKIDLSEQAIAARTISDIDLNDDELGSYDPNSLLNLRKHQLDLVIKRNIGLDDFDAVVPLIYEFTLPDKPFSGFVSAYLASLSVESDLRRRASP